MNQLLIVDSQAPIYVEKITAHDFPDLTIHSAMNLQQAEPFIKTANIMLGSPDFIIPLLSRAENLAWLQSTYAGIDQFCRKEVPQNYILTCVKDIFGPLMSEYVFSYILAIERNLLKNFNQQSKKTWRPIPYRGIDGLTIGIAGLGSIGTHVANTAAHFGMHVLGLKKTPNSIPHIDRIYTPSEKKHFLSKLDYLVTTLPSTPETQHFLQLPDFKTMKDTAIVISVGRGDNINQDDLIKALEKKYIKGAVLDVFEEEPLPANNPLWNMPNVYITPHNSAFSFPAQIASIFCKNYSRFITGKKLKYIVDFKKGY